MPFGRSLHLDVYEVAAESCDDVGFCYQLLDDLVAHLGMHKQAPPFVFRSPHEEYPDKQGISGWVPLIESGISIHTLTRQRFVTLDVYTCGLLEPQATIDFLCRRLGSRRFESHYLERGREYGPCSASCE
jgi:S-adenosylmethionine decarboxylase